jgi:hypothetical protein
MLSGLLPRPEMTMSMMGITFNVHALCFFAAHGLSGAASTRVGNELGAAAHESYVLAHPGAPDQPPLLPSVGASRPRQAWLNTQVSVLMGTVVMMVCAGLLLLGREQLGALFSAEREVVLLTSQAVPALAISLVGEPCVSKFPAAARRRQTDVCDGLKARVCDSRACSIRGTHRRGRQHRPRRRAPRLRAAEDWCSDQPLHVLGPRLALRLLAGISDGPRRYGPLDGPSVHSLAAVAHTFLDRLRF